ncbi:MAG: hypothetical protein P8178_06575 [Candidatus Thiodiazotropha sp.]
MQPLPPDDELKNDISRIEQKRQLLERIVDITHAIENMQASLNAVLVLGVASKDLPADALNLYSSLSASLCNLPVKQIERYYDNLEILIRKQLNRILEYAGLDFPEDDGVEFITLSSTRDGVDPLELLDAFKRTAQTAVSLRVLLRKRGVATPGAAIPVSPQVIRQQLVRLEEQEQIQRTRIKHKIVEMQEDVRRMIDNPAYPAGMQAMLREVVGNLQQDLDQLARGAPVDRLSFVAEMQEIVPVEAQAVEMEEITIEAPAPVSAETSGFSGKAMRWLNSPWDVGWDDLQEEG